MGHLRTGLANGVAAVLTVGSASAQTAYDGTYWGFALGAGSATFEGSAANLVGATSGGARASGLVGWNTSRGDMVYGVEGSLGLAAMDGSVPCFNTDWICTSSVAAVVIARGRIGQVFGSNLVYVTAGFAGAKFELATVLNTTDSTFPDSVTDFGYLVGAGIERISEGGWNLRAEITLVEFGASDYQLDRTYGDMDATMTALDFSLIRRF